MALTCMIVVVDGHCGCVVVTQNSFRGGTAIQRNGADLRITDHSRVTQVDVEILIFLEDVIVNHPHCDFWQKNCYIIRTMILPQRGNGAVQKHFQQ